ncbi:hypothetical protein EIP91_006104, partial [Steccherinum ochraceum]
VVLPVTGDIETKAPTQKRKAGNAFNESERDILSTSLSRNNSAISTSSRPNVSSSRPTKRPKTVHPSLDATLPHTDIYATVGPECSGLTKYELTEAELQIVKSLDELISHGVRAYATGFDLQDNIMSLWYADRMGIVQSATFDILREPWSLILVIAAHRYGSARDFGVNPLISLSEGSRVLKDYSNALVTLPSAIPATLPSHTALPAELQAFDDGQATALSHLQFKVQLDMGRGIVTSYGAVGRGTCVLPVTAMGAVTELYGDDRLVVKLSYPLESREPEDQFIRVIRRKMSAHHKAASFLKHVVDLKCSFTGKMDDGLLGLPRAMMANSVGSDMRRSLRVLVVPEYLPLERLNTPQELCNIMCDVVTGHYWVWTTSHILHCDISYGNIMFYYEGTKVVGVLTDWDLAALIEDDPTVAANPPTGREADKEPGELDDDSLLAFIEQQWGEKERTRTGTSPFMALDLLEQGAIPPHRYRHDLESFFWVLVWFCAVFDPVHHTVGVIPSWQRRNVVDVGTAKKNFLFNRADFNETFVKTHPNFRYFVSSSIIFLRTKFLKAKRDYDMTKECAEEFCMYKYHVQEGSRQEEELMNLRSIMNDVMKSGGTERMITCEGFVHDLKRSMIQVSRS